MANIKAYMKDTVDELVNKVTWPSYAELQSSAIVVLIASVIIALLIWLMDYAFGVNSAEDAWWKGVLGLFYSTFK